MTRTAPIATLLAAVSVLGVAACGGGSSSPLSGSSSGAAGTKAPSGTIVVGSANFPENVLLMNIYAEALKSKGVKVDTKPNIGSRETYIPGLKDGSIDLIPEYTGVLLQYFDKNATAVSPKDVYQSLQKALPPNLIVLEKSSAQDKDAVVVTKETAQKYNLETIGDLKPVAGKLKLGGPPEWKTRPTGVPGLKKKYGLDFKEFVSLDTAGPLTIQALKSGRVDAADVFTTDPSIAENNWVILKDPKNLFAAQNVVPLINKAKATPKVKQALNAVSAKLTTDGLGRLVKQVVSDKKDPNTVAKQWLSSQGLG
jgi:osmoprotectant transport system substrate-binding protein